MGAYRFERGRGVVGDLLACGRLLGGEVVGVPAGELL
jgi:hypothetical protein